MQFGVHANVWEGSWTPEEAKRAIAGTAAAGYDLIEGGRVSVVPPPHPAPCRASWHADPGAGGTQ